MIAFQTCETQGIPTLSVGQEVIEQVIFYVLVSKLIDESVPELCDALKGLYLSRCGSVQEGSSEIVSSVPEPAGACADSPLRNALVNLLSFAPTSDEPTEQDLAGVRSHYQFPE
jgi:hypothetical protein